MVTIVQWTSAPVFSRDIGPPESFCFSGSLVVRSGLTVSQEWPLSEVRKRKFPPQ